MSKFLISVVGPTAIGKTNLSIKLAQYFNTEIVSADSRQFFTELEIGTAVPSHKELSQVNHHFIHHKSIHENYSVSDFEKEALTLLDKLYKIHNVIIVVGGSGLYIDALINGLDYFPKIEPSIRRLLNLELTEKGLPYLQSKLKDLDKIAFQNIAINNPQRVIRALEVCMGSGKPYSSFLNNKKITRNFKTIFIGLTAERSMIYNRINQRVDNMMEQGLLNEVQTLNRYRNLNALNTIGYKELFNYLDNNCELDTAISEIKKNSRRYAKRQITWFKKNTKTQWFNIPYQLQDILNCVDEKIQLSHKN